MLSDGVILASALVYMSVLFGIAYYGDQRADAGRSIIANPYIYTLSLAIYCTAWTFYGSVGLAASSGRLLHSSQVREPSALATPNSAWVRCSPRAACRDG